MNILYIAYSCSPNHGSEDRIGWMIPLYSARKHRVWVITKEEHRAVISDYQSRHPDLGITFCYVDIPKAVKGICRGAAYAGRLGIWQKRALSAARELCSREKIDLIHQITPVEFRTIGDYGSIPGVKFVCGPVGGGETIPRGLRHYARRHGLQEAARHMANRAAVGHLRRSGILSRCDGLLFANRETKDLLGAGGICMTETGIDDREIRIPGQRRTDCVFLAVGRMVYRKGQAFLLDALRGIPASEPYRCILVGWGPDRKRLERLCRRYGLQDRVTFHARVSYDEMMALYEKAHVLVMPSIRETTGSVLLEAMARGLPVITTGGFGGALLVDESVGWQIDGDTRADYIRSLQNACLACIHDPIRRAQKGSAALQRAKAYTWAQKAAQYDIIYSQVQKGDG